VGLKVTLIVQLAAAFSEVPQVFDSAKFLSMDIELIMRVPLPVLESVTVCGVLVDPTFKFPKDSDAGETLAITIAAAPVPLRLMV
jgi:hypothetical protein